MILNVIIVTRSSFASSFFLHNPVPYNIRNVVLLAINRPRLQENVVVNFAIANKELEK